MLDFERKKGLFLRRIINKGAELAVEAFEALRP